ncbi:hypothetical protein WN48_02416 [Eufriesea mexicana]|nr:hypothetical protein WN48_02416 [Eufriesea mexicana]
MHDFSLSLPSFTLFLTTLSHSLLRTTHYVHSGTKVLFYVYANFSFECDRYSIQNHNKEKKRENMT